MIATLLIPSSVDKLPPGDGGGMRPMSIRRRTTPLSVRERTYWLCTAWLSPRQMFEWPIRTERR